MSKDRNFNKAHVSCCWSWALQAPRPPLSITEPNVLFGITRRALWTLFIALKSGLRILELKYLIMYPSEY